MKQTRFYVNGYLYNLGELLSYEISKQDFDKIYNAQLESLDDENIIVSLEANKVDLEEMLLVTSITTTPLEDEEYMFTDGMMSLKAIYKKKDPAEVIPDFNALVKHSNATNR